MFNLFKKKPKEEPKVEPVVEQPQGTFEDEPAVKIYIEDYMNDEMHHIGWIPKEDAETVTDILKKHDCSIEINVEGGKTKTFDGDNIEIEEKPVFVDVKISYEVNC